MLKFRLNFSAILNPAVERIGESCHTITGNLATGEPVRVERYLRAWTPHLKIVVADRVVHDSDTSAEDRTAFNALRCRAIDEQEAKHIGNQEAIREAAKVLFTLTPK
jgi:hypothetical protein